jgi:hypothetical protein
MNWNLSIQHEFAKNFTAMVGYVGSHSLHTPVSADDINLVQPVGFTSAGLLYPIPGTGTKLNPNAGGNAGIRPLIFDGAALYNGLQAQLRKNLSHGVQGQLSYT